MLQMQLEDMEKSTLIGECRIIVLSSLSMQSLGVLLNIICKSLVLAIGSYLSLPSEFLYIDCRI
jgi:hypothetical protein